MLALINYLAYAIVEGDFLNDWLTHMPPFLSDLIVNLIAIL